MRRKRKKTTLLAFLIVLFLVIAVFIQWQDSNQAEPLSKRSVTYHMNVQLDENNQRLYGKQTIVWKHPGERPLQDVFIHLYPNAFRSPDTSFMKESGGHLRQDSFPKGQYGGMEITKLIDQHGNDLLERLQFVQPDDGNVNDLTLARVDLPTAVSPGEELRLQVEFTVQLPGLFARMGYQDQFVMAGQWYPKLAAYETRGTRGRTLEGWNAHQYHGNSEFYGNFGVYHVNINTPDSYIVAASGVKAKEPIDQDGRRTYSFYGADIHDFAWSASPDYHYDEMYLSGKQLPGVTIQLYLDPTHIQWKERYFQAAQRALTRFSEWYGSYPYQTLSIVVPPSGAGGAGGMEYPTLITAWAASDNDPTFELERVIVHEIGHQFFYGMVANNEGEEAWLDEAFTSYAEDRLMQSEYGRFIHPALESSYVTEPSPLTMNAWDYQSHDHYAENVYTRGKLVLKEIEQRIGTKTMNRVLRIYFERWKFRHPSTESFLQVLEDVTGQDWKVFFDTFIYQGQMTDYAVQSIESKPVTDKKTLSAIEIRRLGAVSSQVPILIGYLDGSQSEHLIDGQQREMVLQVEHAYPATWVMIDPRYTMTLEHIRYNNYLAVEVPSDIRARWHMSSTKIVDLLIGWLTW